MKWTVNCEIANLSPLTMRLKITLQYNIREWVERVTRNEAAVFWAQAESPLNDLTLS